MPVKGPRLYRMRVVPDRPGRRRLQWLGALAVLGLSALTAFALGRYSALLTLAGDAADAGTVASLERLVQENSALREELAVHRGSGDVAREVEERVRSDNRQMQDRVAELEQALADYRRTVLPDRAGKGLRIERAEVAAGAAPGTWLLRVLLVRTGDKDGLFEGDFEGTLFAEGAAGRTQWPLAQLVPAAQRRFGVRYVGEYMLELHLPPGQTPVKLDLAASLSAPRADRIEKSWQRQAIKPREVPVNAGQG